MYKNAPPKSVGFSAHRDLWGRVLSGIWLNYMETDIISLCNTPVLPVRRPNGQWYQFVQDLRAINKIAMLHFPVVLSQNTSRSSITPEVTYFTVVYLCTVFFSVPLGQNSQYLFVFPQETQQHAWAFVSLFFTEAWHTPTVFPMVSIKNFNYLNFLCVSVLMQYVDDFLLCLENKQKSL